MDRMTMSLDILFLEMDGAEFVSHRFARIDTQILTDFNADRSVGRAQSCGTEAHRLIRPVTRKQVSPTIHY